MKKAALAICILTVFLAAFCLGGCAAKPYSTDQVTDYLERQYGGQGRFALQEESGDGHYVYLDTARGVSFSVTAVTRGWGENALLPFAHRAIYARLNRGIMYALRQQAAELADGYGLTLLGVDGFIPAGSSDDDHIYVADPSQLEAAASLFFDLFALYELETAEDSDAGACFYYCEAPGDAQSRQGAVLLSRVKYRQLVQGKGYLVFEDHAQLCQALLNAWQDAAQWNSALPAAQ